MAEGNYNKDEISTFIALPVVMCDNNATQLPEQLAFKNVIIQKLDDGSICLIDTTNLNISKLTLDDNSTMINPAMLQDQAMEPPSIKLEQLQQSQKPIYQCLNCPQSFGNVNEFRKHVSSHHVTKKYTCDKCSLGYNEEVNFKIHMALHFEGKQSCPICDISFQRLASLKSHLMLHQVEELYSCQECSAEFEKEEELNKHFQSHWKESSKDTLVCGYCLLELKDKAEYKEHISSHVQMKKTVLSGKRTRKTNSRKEWTHSCTECNKKFSKASLLERHLRVHSGERPFVCEFCNKGFNQKGTLQIHLNKHSGLKPYECTLCPAKFAQKGNLRAHVKKTHTAPTPGVKTFKCTHCTCIFKKIASLNVHTTKFHSHKDASEDITAVLTQLKELDRQIKSGKTNEMQKFEKEMVEQNRKVLDEITDQNAASSDITYVKLAESFLDGTVRRYIVKRKIVNDIKYYICNYCKKEFKKPSDLIRHTRVHTKEKPFQCNKCGATFSLKYTLLNHIKAHHSGANTSSCYICSRKFNYPRSLKLHLKKHLLGKLKSSRASKMATKSDEHVKVTLSQPLVETDNGLMSVVNSKAENQEKGQYQCQICKSCYLKPRNLRRHMLTHNREKRFKCDQCPKCYFTRQQLMIHTSSHTGIKNYACHICKKKYVTSSTLTRHMTTHNSAKPFVCPYCQKKFKSLYMCRKHMNIHKKDLIRMVDGADWKYGDGMKSIPDVQKKIPDMFINPADMLNSAGDDNQKHPQEKSTLPEKDPLMIHSNVTINQIDNIPQISVPEVSSNQIDLLQQIASNSIQLIAKEDQNAVQTIFVNCQNMQLSTDSNGALCNNNLYPQDEKIQNTDTLLYNSLKELQDGHVFNIHNLHDFEPPVSQTTEPFSNNQIFNVNQIINPETPTIPDLSSRKMPSPNSTAKKINDKNDSSTIPAIDITINDGILTSNMPYYPTPDVNLFFNIDADLDPPPSDLPTTLPDEINLNEAPETLQEKSDQPPHVTIKCEQFEAEERPKKKFTCSHCKRGFDTKNSWKKHVASHARPPSKPTHACMFCQKMFKKQSDLTRHIRTHTGERPFACDKCDRKFTLKSTLVSHERTHDPVSHKIYNCICCNSFFTSKSGLKVHMNTHTGTKPHACSFCPQKFTTSAHKRSHESSAHNASKKRSHNKKVTDMLSSIAMDVVSSQHEPNPENLDITHEDLENVLVVQQQLQLPSESDNLNLLNETAIPNTLTDAIQFDPVILQQLQSTQFLFQDQLISPQSVIQLDDGTLLNIKSISTDLVAPVENLVEPEVKTVVKKPERERNHECDICHKKYASKDVLRKHKKIHGLNKKFPCSKCDKGFDTEDALMEHGKVHLGYQFPCMYCANSFTHQQSLTTHMKRIHNISSTPLRDNLFLYTLKD